MTTEVNSIINIYSLFFLSGGMAIGILLHLGYGWAKVRSSKEEASRLVDLAHIEAKTIIHKAEIGLEAEISKKKSMVDKELKARKKEMSKLETKIEQKDSRLKQKLEEVKLKLGELSSREKDLESLQSRANSLHEDCLSQLEKMANFSREEAKDALIQRIENQFSEELGQKVTSLVGLKATQARDESLRLIAQAVQQSAIGFQTEGVATVVKLSDPALKGKIIGKEGVNIRAFKDISGLDVLLDEMPDMIALSGFDPVGRAIGARTLKTLLDGGRITPEKITEVYKQIKSDTEREIFNEGKRAAKAASVPKLSRKLLMELGKLKFKSIRGQNLLVHSVECAQIAGVLAAEVGLDPKMARRAGLLHDIGRILENGDASHDKLGADFASDNGEGSEVVNAILAHHDQKLMETPLAFLVGAADAISRGRAGARSGQEPLAIERLEEAEQLALEHPSIESAFAIRAGDEIKVLLEPENNVQDLSPTLSFDLARKLEEKHESSLVTVAIADQSQTVVSSL